MAVLGRLLVSSAERLDLPDLLSLDSYAAGDWKYFLKGFVGDSRPYILKGFDVIDPQNAIGTQSCSIRVADSVVFYPGSNSGAFFHGLQEGHVQAAPLVPELRKNAVNYVYLTLSTFNTSVDTRAFWDPDKDGGAGGEFTQDVNTESVLKVEINVSTGSFPANTIPVAKITVGPVTITAIEDARDLMFRLGSGGISPDPFNQFNWKSLPSSPYERAEPPTQMTAGGVNPFQGADKNIGTLKEWMDAVMSKLRELGGTTYWYEDTSTFGLVSGYFDAVGTAFKSKGTWSHDASTPGFLTWSEDLNIKMTSDPRTYIIRQGNKTLADEQVMYVPMVRNQAINGTDTAVSWTNGQAYVNTVGGAVGLFANLAKGDWVKKSNDSFDKWLRVEEFYDAINLGGSTTSAANARSIRLSGNYLGSTAVEKARYDKGAYLAADVVVSDRDDVNIYNSGGNFHWLAMRSDTIQNISNAVTTALSINITEHDGSTAKVTSGAPHGLVDGDRVTIAGTTNFNGTYVVEVESAIIFYISLVGSILADESGSAYYATITTAARSTAYGFQEESASHGLKSNDAVAVSNTTNFNGTYEVNVRNSTQFTIPVPSNIATETSGLMTLARVIVRTEGAVSEIVQGQIVDISDAAAENMRLYLGMSSLSETYPTYNISGTYNTLHGMVNYNSIVNENLTARVSKLSAMMADKAQDKTIKYIPSGIVTVTNTTNGAAQEITFNPSGATLTLVTPGSTGNAVVSLPDTAPGISLLANQLAYVVIDRNSTTTPSIVVSNVANCPIGENLFVIAVRLSGTDVYLWDGSLAGPKPVNSGIKVIGGGTISVSGNDLSFSSDLYLEVKGLDYTDNTIDVTESPITFANDYDVAYVIPNALPGGPSLSVIVDVLSNVPANAIIIARREGATIIVGSSSTKLKNGQSTTLYSQISDQTLTYIGAADAAISSPTYSSNIRGTAAENLTARVGSLTHSMGDYQEDRSAYLRSDNPVTWTGTQLQFTTNIVLEVINTKTGAAKTATILTALSPITLANNESAWVKIDRTLASENLTVNLSGTTPIPAQSEANKDVIVIARRQDVLGAGYLHLPLHKQVLEPGQTVRLGASGSGEGSGAAETVADGFKAMVVDAFTDVPATPDSKVYDAETNALFDTANEMFVLECDKSKTFTTAGVNYTISGSPTFAVAPGDIIYSGGIFRKIATVLTPTTGTLDVAFPVDLSSAAGMVSQAVYSLDLVNIGDATQKTRLRDFFPSIEINQINVSYDDSLDANDDVPDYVDQANIVVAASNEGLQVDTDIPLSNTFAAIFERPQAPDQIDNYILLDNADKERLFLVFFCNPNNASVIDSANLLKYKCSVYEEETLLNGGTLWSSVCWSDGSITPINCSNPALVSGKSRITFTNPYVPNIGGPGAGELVVVVDGKVIPRYYPGVIGAYYTEVDPYNIDLWTDISVASPNLSVHVRRQVGSVDTSSVNTLRLNSFYSAVVGTIAQVAAGVATHNLLQDAYDFVEADGNILILKGATTGPLTLGSKPVSIFGLGRGSAISGAVTFSASSRFNTIKNVRFNANVTIPLLATENIITEYFEAPGITINDANAYGLNYIIGIEEP